MSNLRDKKRILGDLRIFQAVHNDLKLSHQEVTLEDGSKTWAYVYEGVDPYELEDSHFPSIIKAVEAERIEALIDELKWARDMAEKDVTGHSLISLGYINERINTLEATLKGVKE